VEGLALRLGTILSYFPLLSFDEKISVNYMTVIYRL
jgi:hypothetical protein